MQDKQMMFQCPEWVKDIKDADIKAGVYSLLFCWNWNGETKKIDNLREYVASKYDDMSDDQINEICDLLIEHKAVA